MSKLLKGAKAFTTSLLFGSNESQGLIRTLGSASLEAGKNLGAAILDTKEDEKDRIVAIGGDPNIPDGIGIGIQGSGYYKDGFLLVPDDETEADYFGKN
ncbi:hypothetical protein [Nitrincola nitratireducens]|uniref:Uncharacterized protein n=1 Tax=Nitrincola nitratireducens TaxID=1229521 RepID=W9UY72_9GAMM|nr:hypothetical protein [Nitrincola nitratireducens]EXJ09676.1 hypothetical protein D791_03348 [Nitrincola nitratireducens]